jgi:hypothetical protein
MGRQTEILSRKDFFTCCPADLVEQLTAELGAWDGGDTCERVEVTTDSLGRIDSESSPRPANHLVRVIYWAGTTRKERSVSTYADAMDLIDREHRNAYSPTFHEIATGCQLFDDGNGLCVEDRSYYVV